MKRFPLVLCLLAPSPAWAISPELRCPAALETQRPQLQASLRAAQLRLAAFAEPNGWLPQINKGLVRQVEVFDRKEAFEAAVGRMSGLASPPKLPKTFAATVIDRVLLCVSPGIFAANNPADREPAAYEKLLAHEMAHQLHEDLVGSEAMGPVWFFEGFAVLAAGQYADRLPNLDPSQVWQVVNRQDRGDYREYAVVIRHFTSLAPLPDLLVRAGREDFLTWLRALEGNGRGQTPGATPHP